MYSHYHQTLACTYYKCQDYVIAGHKFCKDHEYVAAQNENKQFGTDYQTLLHNERVLGEQIARLEETVRKNHRHKEVTELQNQVKRLLEREQEQEIRLNEFEITIREIQKMVNDAQIQLLKHEISVNDLPKYYVEKGMNPEQAQAATNVTQANILTQLEKGYTDEDIIEQPVIRESTPGNLLEEIRRGKTLRRVETNGPKTPKRVDSNNLQEQLRQALADRRTQLKEDVIEE